MSISTPRRILITNCQLDHLTGTEIVVRDLALGLRSVDHEPIVFSPRLGLIAEELTAVGIETVSHLDEVSTPPDLIHGQHHWETVQAFSRFPSVPGLFVCHSGSACIDIPPPLPGILRYVAVDLHCRHRLASYHIPDDRIEVILNAVDLDRVQRRRPLPSHPQRALLFSNYARPGTHLEPIREACARMGLPLDVLGEGMGTGTLTPEAYLNQYDLIFAKARCALEAMAVGAAVILCGTEGLGPLVTSENVAHLRPWNFGRCLLTSPLDPQLIHREMQKYNGQDAAAVATFIRQDASLQQSLTRYQALYETILDEWQDRATSRGDARQHYVQTMLQWVHRQESDLHDVHTGVATWPVEEEAARRCAIHIEDVLSTAIQGQAFFVAVKFLNRTGGPLSSQPPYPVHFSYRWLETSGQTIPEEGTRTPLRMPLASGEERTVFIKVKPPNVPGLYRLRVTVVQEWVRWWDMLLPPVADETAVHIQEDISSA